MLDVKIKDDRIHFGRFFAISVQRTLRIPDDDKSYPLPPGLGRFPLYLVEDYKESVPIEWKKRAGCFIPMYQREALWIFFDAPRWRPHAVRIGIGKINAVSGKPWRESLDVDEQDYLVCPDQLWLDGINVGHGHIRQFVAVPLGTGYTVEGQMTGKEEFGAIQIVVFPPKPGKFPDEPPPEEATPMKGFMAPAAEPGGTMGLAPGGKMEQKIYPDKHGIDSWDDTSSGTVTVHIANIRMFQEITGEDPPATPISAKTYTDQGLPWFELYDEDKGDVAPSDDLSEIKSVAAMDREKGVPIDNEVPSIEISERQKEKLKPKS